MAAPRRPRRGVRPRAQPRAAGEDRRHPRHPGRDERRHPRRRVAGRRDGHRLPPGQHRHRRARAAGVVRRPRSRSTATGSPSASTSAAARSPPAAGPATAATCTTCWPASTPRAAPATWSPTSTRTACSRARTSSCCATSAPPPTARSWPPAGSPRSTTSAPCMTLVPDGVEGAIAGTALYEGRFSLEDALALTQGRAVSLAVRVIPCLDVDGGRVVKGINFQDLRDAGDPVELAKVYDAEGADELTFLDISASHEGRATTMEIVSAHRRAGVHPADRRRGSVHRRGRRPAAARRRRQGGGEHRRDPTGPSWSPRSRTASATRCWCSRWTRAGPAGTASGFEVTTHGGRQVRRARRDRVGGAGRRARRRRDPAQRDGRRRHPGRLRPRPDRAPYAARSPSRSSPPAGPGASSTSRPRWTPGPTRCWRPPSSTSARCGSPTSRRRWRPPVTRCAEAVAGPRSDPQVGPAQPGDLVRRTVQRQPLDLRGARTAAARSPTAGRSPRPVVAAAQHRRGAGVGAPDVTGTPAAGPGHGRRPGSRTRGS